MSIKNWFSKKKDDKKESCDCCGEEKKEEEKPSECGCGCGDDKKEGYQIPVTQLQGPFVGAFRQKNIFNVGF